MLVKIAAGGCVLGGLLGLKYGVPNVRYFAQMIYLGARNTWNKGDILPCDDTELEFTVSLTDIDFMRHMNNASYLRYAEAARHDWFWKTMTQLRGKFGDSGYSVPLIAISIKYRRECKFNDTFVIKTGALYWDKCSLYIKQEFYNKSSGLLHCVLYAKLGLVKNGKFIKQLEKRRDGYYLLKWYNDIDDTKGNDYECRNEMSEDIKLWIQHLNHTKNKHLQSKL